MALPTLDDPFYYLANFHTVLDWLGSRYADLLSVEERDFIAAFEALPRPSRALLVRMVMRKGVDFRASRLCYAEIGDTETAAAPLIAAGWVETDAELALPALFALTTKSELAADLAPWLAELGLSRSTGKTAWREALAAESPAPRALPAWLPSLDDTHYRLTVDAIGERFRLMFFGNLRQQWSEFVLADLGVYRFESVPLAASSRAFSRRGELEAYHHLHRCRERFDADEPLADLLAAIPREPFDNPWLERRRGRLLYKLAYRCERHGELQQALALYHDSAAPEARLRRVRVLERLARFDDAWQLAQRAEAAPVSAAEAQALGRIVPRLRRKLGLPRRDTAVPAEPERITLTLSRSGWVEGAVAAHLSRDEAPVIYVENTLINALFGLLCWEAIFAPLPGAFFHPFHSGPADLFDEDFHARRQALFTACLAALERGDYGDIVRQRFRDKYGIQSPFVAWSALDERTLTLALTCIPARHLRIWFERLLGDIRANRAGMPDLIQFWPGEARYRMIEVKGPGDRLQDNQKRWLAFCAEHAMPVSVCYVSWEEQSLDAAASGPDATAEDGGVPLAGALGALGGRSA
ncbi:VRR-NUC domain-containing protein [Salinicola endophyticus]|uniref:phosphodiesterase I n=1 Tax=Salinicola endophyticus TaxID=1949083 RepID=A0ABY8FK80_9GAMM|nr:VRR-NUC domain-containing protein [Salinicola endophyticus]WFF43201.1 VRR-NUC domain-containing protein [Salinicola endophyticus]